MEQKTNKTILIADDEPVLRDLLKILLESKGFQVLTAVDGEDALAKAQANKVDLVLLDVMMPKMNGYQVCRLLKFDEAYKNIPIVLLTARGQEKDKKTGQDVGADLYVVKPYEPVDLMNKINILMGL